MTELEQLIGYEFKNQKFLLRALLSKHKGNEVAVIFNEVLDADEVEELKQGYEVLEFLGDRVYNLLVAEVMVEKGFDEDTGTKIFNYLRSDEFLKEAGKFLLPFVIASESQKENCIPDVLEALLGAIYLDSGRNLNAVRKFFSKQILPFIELALETRAWEMNLSKNLLQEMAMKEKKPLPKYEVVEVSGPSHSPTFRVVCEYDGIREEGRGKSKKEAEIEASWKVLKKLRELTAYGDRDI